MKNLAPELGLSPDLVLIWFGILVVVVTEISLITPPIGLNVFVLKGVVKDVSVGTIFYGVTPFWIVDIIRLAIIPTKKPTLFLLFDIFPLGKV